jgi:lipopolysaccharide/colanic/teichoic acid biosynthesis glycosyltransferase
MSPASIIRHNVQLRNRQHVSQSAGGQESDDTRVNGQRDRHSPDLKPGFRRVVEPRHSWYLFVKRGVDFVGAIVLLVLLSPCIALGSLLVKLTSRGPAMYRQVRVGKWGREFTLRKLRTMRHDAEATTGPVWSTEFDSRVTPLGKLLRSSHIDEFPQLWNVIRGDMSLVGPRPERPEFVSQLALEVPFYMERLQVRPGITGLAQLRLPADTTLESVRQKVEHDVYYVQHCNPWLDLKLMAFTAWRLVKEVAHYGWKCLVLPTDGDIEHGFQQAVGLLHEDLGVARFPASTIPQSDVDTNVEIVEFGN